jgi:hypothetical protein
LSLIGIDEVAQRFEVVARNEDISRIGIFRQRIVRTIRDKPLLGGPPCLEPGIVSTDEVQAVAVARLLDIVRSKIRVESIALKMALCIEILRYCFLK